MVAVFKTCAVSVSMPALLLVAALMTGAGADKVTTERCQKYGRLSPLRQYPTDGNATELWMFECHITNINYDDLANLPNVETVILFTNDIAHFDPTVFRSSPKLRQLYLHDNKISELSVFGEYSCPSLTLLAFSDNLLTDIRNPRTFSACSKLRDLFLNHNNIVYIHPNTFSDLTELRFVLLDRNKLTYIHQQMFARNSKLALLDLRNNRLTYLPSDFIVNLKHAGCVNLREFYFHSNPWQCSCVLELLEDIKKAGVKYYKKGPDTVSDGVTHYEGSVPECVYAGATSCRRAGLLRAPRLRDSHPVPRLTLAAGIN